MIKLKGDGFEYKGGSRFKHKNGGGGILQGLGKEGGFIYKDVKGGE